MPFLTAATERVRIEVVVLVIASQCGDALKPYVGDPHYDVTQHLFNHSDRLHAQPRQWIRRMAALAELDEARVRAWMLARLVCEGTRVPWYADVARRL